MQGKGHSKCTAANATYEELREPHSFAADELLTNHIEAAVLPLRAYLRVEQVEIVRARLRSGIRSDPVSRVLAHRAVQTPIASMTPACGSNEPPRCARDAATPRDRDIKK